VRASCGPASRDRHATRRESTEQIPRSVATASGRQGGASGPFRIERSEYFFGPPGRPDGVGLNASIASTESQSVTSPRRTSACSYSGQFPTRYFVLYFGCTLEFTGELCDSWGRRHQWAGHRKLQYRAGVAPTPLVGVEICGNRWFLEALTPTSSLQWSCSIVPARRERNRAQVASPFSCLPTPSGAFT